MLNSLRIAVRTTDVLRLVVVAIAASALLVARPSAQTSTLATRRNKLIATLEANRQAIGLYSKIDVEQVTTAELEQYDWWWVDMEHQPYSMDRVARVLAALKKAKNPATAIVRLPMHGDEISNWPVLQLLDAGILGVCVTAIETPEQAMKLVQAMRYPPQRNSTRPLQPAGHRGYNPNYAAEFLGLTVPEYDARADVWPLNPNGDLFAMAVIETVAGVENVDKILSVPGISGVIIGPNDLSISYGFGVGGNLLKPGSGEFNELQGAIARIAKSCVAHRMVCASTIRNLDDYKLRKSQGFRMFLNYWVDPKDR
jgi:4-hydroxy-2-oxoheptanedioate aldolase